MNKHGLRFILAGLGLGLMALAQVKKPPAPAKMPAPLWSVRHIFTAPLPGPAPGGLRWTPNGRRISYFEKLPGHQHSNLYLYNPSNGKSRLVAPGAMFAGGETPLETYRIHLSEPSSLYNQPGYQWSPRSHAVLFTSQNQLQIYNLRGRVARQFTNVKGLKFDPKFSPNGKWISYVWRHQLYYQARSGGAAIRVGTAAPGIYNGALDWVYPEELNIASGYAWSPHSRNILYLQLNENPVPGFPIVDFLPHHATVFYQKYPQAGDANPVARLGIFSLRGQKTIWLRLAHLKNGYLPRFGWYNHGRRAYALVVNRAQNQEWLYGIRPRTGQVRQLLHETSPYWIGVEHDLRFLPHGRFLWGSTRDGWHHFYLYGRHGRLIRQLTQGAENEALAGVDRRGGWVYYTAPGRKPVNQEIFRVALRGGAPRQLTQGGGMNSLWLAPRGRWWVRIYSDALHPPAMTVRSRRHPRHDLRVLQPAADVAAYHLIAPRFFTIPSAGLHTRLWAMMLRPPHFNPAHRYPVIMYQYGGPAVAPAVRNGWSGGFGLFNQLLARKGFIVFVTDNRSVGNFSLAQRARIRHHFGPLEMADQVRAAEWLKAKSYVAARHMGIWGWSFGGFMTTYEMTHTRGIWHAAVAVAPVVNWRNYDTIYTERYMGLPRQNPAGYRDSSPVYDAAHLHGRFLLCQGTSDDNVHFQNSIQLIQALLLARRPFQLMIFPRKTHHIGGPADLIYLFQRMLRFWRHHLHPVSKTQ